MNPQATITITKNRLTAEVDGNTFTAPLGQYIPETLAYLTLFLEDCGLEINTEQIKAIHEGITSLKEEECAGTPIPEEAVDYQTITSHKTNALNDDLVITVRDNAGAGGANHHYKITGTTIEVDIEFQNGPVFEAGFNGITNEALLAILKHRMEGFQSGKFACIENQVALNHINSALETLKSRTNARVARGVEGTHEI
jgi:hypothetical protein